MINHVVVIEGGYSYHYFWRKHIYICCQICRYAVPKLVNHMNEYIVKISIFLYVTNPEYKLYFFSVVIALNSNIYFLIKRGGGGWRGRYSQNFFVTFIKDKFKWSVTFLLYILHTKWNISYNFINYFPVIEGWYAYHINVYNVYQRNKWYAYHTN